MLQFFKQRFQIFGQLEMDFQVFCSPLAINLYGLHVDLQLETTDLQCDSDLKTKLALGSMDIFYQYLSSGYRRVIGLAAKVLCMFGTTYLCEQVFYVMNINKTKLRSRLTHAHLNDSLKVAAAQDLKPDIETLVKSKRCQISGVGLNC